MTGLEVGYERKATAVTLRLLDGANRRKRGHLLRWERLQKTRRSEGLGEGQVDMVMGT